MRYWSGASGNARSLGSCRVTANAWPRRAGRLVLGLALVAGTIGSGRADAQYNGEVQSSAEPWVAQLLQNYTSGDPQSCSGVVVANSWVLTAAHCTQAGAGETRKPTVLQVAIGSTGLTRTPRGQVTTGSAVFRSVDQQANPEKVVRAPNWLRGKAADVALVNVGPINGSRALPLAFEQSVVNRPGPVTFYGYGRRDFLAGPGTLNPLQRTPDGAYVRDPGCDGFNDTMFACYRPSSQAPLRTGTTSLLTGDSGSAALVLESGAWQVQGVAGILDGSNVPTSPDSSAGRVGATSVLAPGPTPLPSTMGDWIRTITSMPAFAPDTILVDRRTGNRWLTRADGYRSSLSVRDLGCFLARRLPIRVLNRIEIDTVPERVGVSVTCDPIRGRPTTSTTAPPTTTSTTRPVEGPVVLQSLSGFGRSNASANTFTLGAVMSVKGGGGLTPVQDLQSGGPTSALSFICTDPSTGSFTASGGAAFGSETLTSARGDVRIYVPQISGVGTPDGECRVTSVFLRAIDGSKQEFPDEQALAAAGLSAKFSIAQS